MMRRNPEPFTPLRKLPVKGDGAVGPADPDAAKRVHTPLRACTGP